MKVRILKLLFLILVASFSTINLTGSYFADEERVNGLTFSTGCWAAPSVPVLNYPPNNHYAGLGSAWDLNPYMDWQDSTSTCPLADGFQYRYQSSHSSDFSTLVYDSLLFYGWLNDSQIPALGTLEGVYYWRVQARDQFGNTSEFSAPWKLVVDRTAPPIPLLYSPGNNTQFNSSALDQTWQQVSDDSGGEVFYDYESYSSYDGTNLSNLRWTGTFSNSANTEGGRIVKHAEGAPNGDVYWRVRARDEAGNLSGWSQVWRFRINNSLGNPTPEPTGTPSASMVVLNEILPDPIGTDSAAMPNGEWVELYNKSDSPVDVGNWFIYDNNDDNEIEILGSRTNTGFTIVPPHGFLVVYRNGDSDFALNQDAGGDSVRLFTKRISDGGALVDSHTYTGSVPMGKSIARFPDGSDTWFDPVPTPGGPNKLEEGPTVDFSLSSNRHAVSFQVNNIKKFKAVSYEITYDAKPEAKQIAGTAELTNEDSFNRNNLILGTCSSLGEVCVYDWGMTKVTLRVVLTLANGQATEIIKEIAY